MEEENIIGKLETLEQLYVSRVDLHWAFHLARAQTGLPESKALFDMPLSPAGSIDYRSLRTITVSGGSLSSPRSSMRTSTAASLPVSSRSIHSWGTIYEPGGSLALSDGSPSSNSTRSQSVDSSSLLTAEPNTNRMSLDSFGTIIEDGGSITSHREPPGHTAASVHVMPPILDETVYAASSTPLVAERRSPPPRTVRRVHKKRGFEPAANSKPLPPLPRPPVTDIYNGFVPLIREDGSISLPPPHEMQSRRDALPPDIIWDVELWRARLALPEPSSPSPRFKTIRTVIRL